METTNYHTRGYLGVCEETFEIKCDWDHRHRSDTSDFHDIVRPLHTLAYDFLEVLDTQPFNVTIRERLATVDFTLANIYRPGTTTPIGYSALPLQPKLLFQQLRRVLVESAYFDWCIETRDWRQDLFASDKVKEANMEKRRLTEEHITLLNNRIQNGTESHEDDKSIAQIQDRIFAGQFFTKKDREEHRIQMDMVETRQNIVHKILMYVKDLMSIHRYEEAQWVQAIFEADETRRVNLENAAIKQKRKKEEAEHQRGQLLKDWVLFECEGRKKEAMEKVMSTQPNDSSTHDISQVTSTPARVNAAQSTLTAPIASACRSTEQMNDLADNEYFYAKASDNLTPYFDLATGRFAIPPDYRTPLTGRHHTWRDSKDPGVFNKGLFFDKNSAYLESAARPARPFYLVAQTYNKMCFDGNVGINTLDLIENRMHCENSFRLRTEKMKMDDEAQRGALAPPTEPVLRGKTWVQDSQETPQHGIKNVLQQTKGNTPWIPCEITTEDFMDYVQNHITHASINKYYKAFLTKEHLTNFPNGYSIVSFEHYEKDFRRQLTHLVGRIINQAQHIRSGYERQLFFHSHLEMASIRRLWNNAAQALSQLEKTMFQAQHLRVQVHPHQALIGVPHPLYQQPFSVNTVSLTEFQAISGSRSCITTIILNDNKKAIYDSDSLNKEELCQAPTFEDNKPNHEDKLRLLQALADQATRRATSPKPAKSYSPLAATPALVARYQQKSDVPGPGHEKIYMGTVFGWASVLADRDRFPGMTNQEYIHHLQKHQTQRINAAKQQREGFLSNSSSPHEVGQDGESILADQADTQEVIENVLGGAAADGHDTVQTDSRIHQPGQLVRLPHAQARMPVKTAQKQQQHLREKPKSRGSNAGSHPAHLGLASTKPRTPSMLGRYAMTAETTPKKEMHVNHAVNLPQLIAEDSTLVVDSTTPASLPPLCSLSRDDHATNSKPKIGTFLANGTELEPEGRVRLPQIANDIFWKADTTVSESSPLLCSSARDDSIMALKRTETGLIQVAPEKPQLVEIPMPQIVSESSKDSAPLVKTTAPAPSPFMSLPASDASVREELKPEVETPCDTARFSLAAPKKPQRVEMPMPQIVSKSCGNGAWVVDKTAPASFGAARFSLLFYDGTKAGSARFHYSDTRADAVSFAVTDALHRGLNPATAPFRAAIGFSSDSLTDEEIMKAVEPLMPFLCCSERSMETIKKALTGAVDALAEGIHPLMYLHEFIRFTTVAPPEKVTAAIADSKPTVEISVKTPVETTVNALIKTPVTGLRISSVAAGIVSVPTKSPLSPLALAFIPSPDFKDLTMSGNRVAASPVANSPIATSSFQSGCYMNQSSSPIRIREHICSIICAAGSPLGLPECILFPAANNLASLSPAGVKHFGPFSLPGQQVRFPGNTTVNTAVNGPKTDAVSKIEKSTPKTPIKSSKLESRSVSITGGSLGDPSTPQTPTKCPTVERRRASTAHGSLRDPGMRQKSSVSKPNHSPTQQKMVPGPFVKDNTSYYKTPTNGGLVASRVASFGVRHAGVPLVSVGCPRQVTASDKAQGFEMPHNLDDSTRIIDMPVQTTNSIHDGRVSASIANAVESIKRAIKHNPGLESNSAGATAPVKVRDGQVPKEFMAAQKAPPKQKGLPRSKWAPASSAPNTPLSKVANRNRPLRGPHADALAMFEDLQSQQRTSGGKGGSQPPMVTSKSSFNLDVEMTDAPVGVNAIVSKKNPARFGGLLDSMRASSLPQAWEPGLKCNAIKRTFMENPGLTDPDWCPQRAVFPATPPSQRPSPLNIDRKDKIHGFRRERAVSFSQTSPVFQNETKYGPPRLKGLAVRLPKESHSSPRMRNPPGASSPLSPQPRLYRREFNTSPRRGKFIEKLRSAAKQTPVPIEMPPEASEPRLLPEALSSVSEETRHAIKLPFNNVKADALAPVRAHEALLDEIAAPSLVELLRGIKNADGDLRKVADGDRNGLIEIRGYLEHEYSKRQLVLKAQKTMMDEAADLTLTELEHWIKNVDVKHQKENDDGERRRLTECRECLDHELSKRQLAQEVAETHAEEVNAIQPGRVTLPDFSKFCRIDPKLLEASHQGTTDLSYNFPSEQVALQRAHQAKLAGDADAKLKAQSSAPAESPTFAADRASKRSIDDSERKIQELKAAVAKAAARKAAAAHINVIHAHITAISESISAEALETTLSAFGQVTILYFNPQKGTALVEFATLQQYQAAFDANPHKIEEETIRIEPRGLDNGPFFRSMARAQSSIVAVWKKAAERSTKSHASAPAVVGRPAASQVFAKKAVTDSGKLMMQVLVKEEEKAAQRLAKSPKRIAGSNYADPPASSSVSKRSSSSELADEPAQGLAPKPKRLAASLHADAAAPNPTLEGRTSSRDANASAQAFPFERLSISEWADQPAPVFAPNRQTAPSSARTIVNPQAAQKTVESTAKEIGFRGL